jgi:cytochrome o ubiquinol oxidase subunit 1
MYILGIMGATRRLDHYDASTGWQPLFIMMFIGGLIIGLGLVLQIAQIVASFIQKNRLRDSTGDPWDGRSLEWAVASPPPFYNFTVIPKVKNRDAFWEMKQRGLKKTEYEDIHIPKNTAAGIYISIFAFFVGFAFVWHITWMAVVSLIGIIVVLIVRTFNEETEYTIPAAEVQKLEEARIKKAQQLERESKPDTEEDMSIWELARIVVSFGLGLVRQKIARHK